MSASTGLLCQHSSRPCHIKSALRRIVVIDVWFLTIHKLARSNHGGFTNRVEKSRDFSRASDQIPLNSFGCYAVRSTAYLTMMQRTEPVGNARATNDLV